MRDLIPGVARLRAVLRYLWRAKKRWTLPRRADVLVFDATNWHAVGDYIERWRPELLHLRGEEINIPVLLAALFARGKRSQAYVDRFIACVQPRLIITFIDNSPSFYRLKQRHPLIKTMFVQNGWRGYYGDVFKTLDDLHPSAREGLAVDYLLTFGAAVGEKYLDYMQGTVVPLGSVKNNQVRRRPATERGTLAFISQGASTDVDLGGRLYSEEEFFGRAYRVVLDHLTMYAAQRNLRFVIIPRRHSPGPAQDAERDYFRRMLRREPEFVVSKGQYPSYAAVDAAEVVVSIDSTLGYEAIARGAKTAMFCVRSAILQLPGFEFGWPLNLPDSGPFWTNRPDGETFTRILDHLFAIEDAQWHAELDAIEFNAVMTYDPDNTALTSTLSAAIGATLTQPIRVADSLSALP